MSTANAPRAPTVLIVDDNEPLLRALQKSLVAKPRAWDAVFVQGGPAAVEALRHGPFDVVVTDFNMPDVDGRAVIAAAVAARPGVFRILTSASDAMQLDVEAEVVLQKPYNVGRLWTLIDWITSAKKQQARAQDV